MIVGDGVQPTVVVQCDTIGVDLSSVSVLPTFMLLEQLLTVIALPFVEGYILDKKNNVRLPLTVGQSVLC
jgi:hypothetical protein